MYQIYNGSDLTQLAVKRQMRNNQSILFLIKGTDRIEETSNLLKVYSNKCTEIFYERVIEKPTYDEVQNLNMVIQFTKNMDVAKIVNDIDLVFDKLGESHKRIVNEAVFQVFQECLNNKLSKTMITNGYIRCLATLNYRLNNVIYNLDSDNRILYIGKPDKYDILAFTVLGLCGVDVVICDLDEGITSECMCQNRFILINGVYKNIDLSFLRYINKGIVNTDNNTVVVNDWVDFKNYKTLEDALNLISYKSKMLERYEKNKWKIFHLELQGISDIQNYNSQLENFMLNLKASNRPFILFDCSVPKPFYDETEDYSKYTNKDVFSIFSNYAFFEASGVIGKVKDILDGIEKKHNFTDSAKADKYKDTLKLWLIRYLKLFFNSEPADIPLVIGYNLKSEKEKELIQLLGCLPVDIVTFYSEYTSVNRTMGYSDDFKCFTVGSSYRNSDKYPVNTGVGHIATTAYNAQQELNDILYTDTSLFRIKQFKNVNSMILKTTYEEVGIYWNEPAKFRPSFDSVGDLVTVPTIFAKINGTNENYLSDIKKLMTKNCLLYQSFPIQLEPSKIERMGTLRDFTKQLVFKDNIDFERLIKSPYYTYGVYSEETQQLIIDKVKKLISMDWCNTVDKNLVYEVLDTVFRLPPYIMQMIHNYDFTGDIPKVIIFNGSNQPCTLSDCILIMFLKLVGFDIIIYAPTGYRVVEQYIKPQWFNENTIGQYDYSMENVNFNTVAVKNESKKSFFSRFFN